jgi:hypothetical protein
MLTNKDSLSPEEKIKQLTEFEEEKRKELEAKKKEFDDKKKELEQLEVKRKKETEETRKEIEENIEEISLDEQRRFEELEEIRRRKEQEAASLEEVVGQEQGRQGAVPGQQPRAYGEAVEEIMRGNPNVYDITNYNVMNQLERLAQDATQRPLSPSERNFVELVQYHAERMSENEFYRNKDTNAYMKRELDKIDQINRALRKKEKPGDYEP